MVDLFGAVDHQAWASIRRPVSDRVQKHFDYRHSVIAEMHGSARGADDHDGAKSRPHRHGHHVSLDAFAQLNDEIEPARSRRQGQLDDAGVSAANAEAGF